jgi:tetratricopeptide (TPR) repeat protein
MYTLDALVEEVAKEPHPATESCVWQVARHRTDDSSVVFGAISKKLEEASEGLCPIVVSPPRGALDTGSIALVQVSVGLMNHQMANGALSEQLRQHGPWADKIAAVEQVLRTHVDRDRIVLLINEPQTWASRKSDPEDPEFGEHAEDVAQLVRRTRCRKIVVEHRAMHPVTLDISCGDRMDGFLTDSSQWGSLAGFATEVLKKYGDSLRTLTQTEVRLLVGLAATQESWPASVDDPFSYIRRFESVISGRRTAGDLRELLSKLALLRGGFTDAILDRFQVEKLGQPWRDMLKFCILQRSEDLWVLPSVLHRASAMNEGRWLSREKDARDRPLHSEIARYYVEQFDLGIQGEIKARAYLPNMEAFYHAGRAADRSLAMQQETFFSEQLNALGKELSQAEMYDAAAEVFRESLQWDPKDDYAHHYLAYNLDVQGKDRKTVEEHYTAAISYAPFKAWWWSRWICFLITVGKTEEAEREWVDALSTLGLDEQNSVRQPSTFFHIHSWVLRLLLHRGQLDFASRVLENIPESAFAEDVQETGILQRLRTHFRSLIEARRNRAVMPVFIDHDRWWARRPIQSVAEPSLAGKPLHKWYPGRIEGVEDGQVSIALGVPPDDGEAESDVRTWVLTRQEFDKLSGAAKYELHAGRFIELVYYADDPEPRLFVRPDEKHALPPVRPDPARYLRNRWGGV